MNLDSSSTNSSIISQSKITYKDATDGNVTIYGSNNSGVYIAPNNTSNNIIFSANGVNVIVSSNITVIGDSDNAGTVNLSDNAINSIINGKRFIICTNEGTDIALNGNITLSNNIIVDNNKTNGSINFPIDSAITGDISRNGESNLKTVNLTPLDTNFTHKNLEINNNDFNKELIFLNDNLNIDNTEVIGSNEYIINLE